MKFRASATSDEGLALLFFDARLRYDPELREHCTDKPFLYQTIREWLEERRSSGWDMHWGPKPSSIFVKGLLRELKLARQKRGGPIVWRDWNHSLDQELIRVKGGISTVDSIAMKFYDSKLEDNPSLRLKCSDRHVLEETFRNWKNETQVTNCSPYHQVYSLRVRWKLIDSLTRQSRDAVLSENVIVWKHTPFDATGSDKETKIAKTLDMIRNSRADLEDNRNGIVIDQVALGSDNICTVGETSTQDLVIRNESDLQMACHVKSSAAMKKGIMVEGETSFVLRPGRNKSVTLSFRSRSISVTKALIVFDFTVDGNFGEDEIDPFSIARYISVRSVSDASDYELVKPIAPYVRQKPPVDTDWKFTNPVRVKPSGGAQTGFAIPLSRYPIPTNLRYGSMTDVAVDLDAVYREGATEYDGGPSDYSVGPDDYPVNAEEGQVEEKRAVDYSTHLNAQNYRVCMSRLLWIEEQQMEVDIKSYDLEGVPLERDGRHYKITVPGLAENRPSVLKGDKININADGARFEGVVLRTTQENAIMELPRSFARSFINGQTVDVRFNFSRTNLRTSHQALGSLKLETQSGIIFPRRLDANNLPLTPLSNSEGLNFINRNLNPEQRTAVAGVLESVARPCPYLIFGPPGTGKTVTVVESILQTLKATRYDQEARILVCAPSNTATDVIVQRLVGHVQSTEMIRLMAYSRDSSTVPEDIMQYTNYDQENDSFLVPDLNELTGYRIVAATISTGSKLPNNGLVDHFTHVFVDEAGHQTEPETLGCLISVTKQDRLPSITLAGDPKQLGPIIRSDLAKKFGLDKSLLERLIQLAPYQRRDGIDFASHYDTRHMTKLIHNYRSHEAILELPNELFYDGDLIVAADAMRRRRFSDWEHLPKRGFPVIFHGIEGEDMREMHSPSWFNPDEVQQVLIYVNLLLKDTKKSKCKPEEVGIVAPYHRQVQKIRRLLDKHGYFDVKVGSVEEFQGSERPVIIISTVRSSVEHISFDQKHKIGFLSNPKRFNVAITRAQALLIVIGNPYTLEGDPNWNSLIEHTIRGGGYTGVKFVSRANRQEQSDDIEDVIDGLSSVDICGGKESDDGEADDGGDFIVVSHVTAQEGPAWRGED